jgi:hypothetical protein
MVPGSELEVVVDFVSVHAHARLVNHAASRAIAIEQA